MTSNQLSNADYLASKIEAATETWKGVDTDEFMNELMTKHTVNIDIQRSELEWPIDDTEEVWLEYGWTAMAGMLWYNEGNSNEIGYWTRQFCQKALTNQPKGEMYFLMRSRGIEHKIIVGD